MEIRLWSVVAEPVALAAAGPGAEETGGSGAWFAAGPHGVVVVVAGGVRTHEDLTVPGPLPRVVERHLAGEPQPAVLAFARLPEGCLALGAARVTRIGRRRGAVQDLELRLDAPLPYEFLDRVRPTGPPGPQPDIDWVNLLPDDPATALERFVAGWYNDVPSGAPEKTAGLPQPLQTFHRAAAGRAEVYGRALEIFREAAATSEPGMIAFGQEGDGVFTLLTEAAGDDPRVWYHGLSDQPLRERERLGAYLMMVALAHAAMDSSPGGMAFADRAQTRRIVGPLRRVPLRPMRWPCAKSRFYVGPGVVALVGEDDGDWFEVYVGARHRSLLRRLRKLGLDWESFDG
ncbi:hypothetical protein AMIS_61320 [Actinoplanes missouriensis 431]|uniref:Uncharacterized protein n=1 Tax=Actinoplanes missouriensis (strain ATCC 14538 / DSM 43046 / CBS 188.64 / JCM 3121 / NBRC 102363 / NCIMB 12654 / NRRL B-3342 / UNCC 431) TaxID=512565 RepID=I0HEB5_ACTM4|nr:hypothetical protein [Actinoplanes missouriensis]BAL91352.1 hypothetical protein AMIS_61320 [Actinoplanes missouriensis 431]